MSKNTRRVDLDLVIKIYIEASRTGTPLGVLCDRYGASKDKVIGYAQRARSNGIKIPPIRTRTNNYYPEEVERINKKIIDDLKEMGEGQA